MRSIRKFRQRSRGINYHFYKKLHFRFESQFADLSDQDEDQSRYEISCDEISAKKVVINFRSSYEPW